MNNKFEDRFPFASFDRYFCSSREGFGRGDISIDSAELVSISIRADLDPALARHLVEALLDRFDKERSERYGEGIF
jgi:hypothetical protein